MHSMHERHESQARQAPAGRDLLTAQQVGSLLAVDTSTVYRMAGDGRLPAIKVGRQWRFPAGRVQAVLGGAAPAAATAWDGGAHAPAAAGVPADANAVALGRVLAEALGVMLVLTDMDGRPQTPVLNPCPWLVSRGEDAALVATCTREWRNLARDPDLAPSFHTGALGFQCARAFVRSGSRLLGMVLVGGIAPPDDDGRRGLYHLDDDQQRQVLALLPRIAALFSRLAGHAFEPPADRTGEFVLSGADPTGAVTAP